MKKLKASKGFDVTDGKLLDVYLNQDNELTISGGSPSFVMFKSRDTGKWEIIDMPNKKYIPEAGEACEYSFGGVIWEEAVVKAISGDEVWLKDESGDAIVNITQYSFRPIKTKQEIEREESEEAIFQILYEHDDYRTASTALYDAGYRKVGDEVSVSLQGD